MMFIRTDNTPLKFIQKRKRPNVFVYFLKQWRAAIFPHKKKSFLAEKKFCGEVIVSCVKTSVHARIPRTTLKKSRACKKKKHAKSTRDSRKNYIIEKWKIKKVNAPCEK